MNEGSSHGYPQRWFLWGMVLAGLSSIPFITLFFTAFKGISQEKATGLAAVAGGLTEGYVMFGLLLSFLLPVAAIVLLGKSFSGSNRTRRLFSVLFIGWSSFILLLYSLGGWLLFVENSPSR